MRRYSLLSRTRICFTAWATGSHSPSAQGEAERLQQQRGAAAHGTGNWIVSVPASPSLR